MFLPDAPCLSSHLQNTMILDAFARGPLICETALWGLFSCLIAFACLLWMRDTLPARRLMLALCLVMYTMATVHWGLTFGWWRAASQKNAERFSSIILDASRNHSAYTFMCGVFDTGEIDPIHTGDVDPSMNHGDSYWLDFSSPPPCAPASMLTTNVILSDAVVLFRACAIWSHKRTINTISVVLFTLLLVSSGLNLWHSCSGVEFTFEGLGNPDSGCPFCDKLWGLPAVCTSLVLNIWATAVIGCKAWTHKRIIKTYLTTGNTRTRAEKVLALLVDSGALYSALWAFLMIVMLTLPWAATYLQIASLVQLVGMYPTILVIAISIENFMGSETIRTLHVLTQHSCPPEHHVQVNAMLSDSANSSSSPSVVELHAIADLGDVKPNLA
ncbi:hypothetical protein BC629DRAFT_1560484 [Irpex lacteus]|nr:hypothetical protein BC629DRAFT_1560484 [Irpex lacteus]